MPPYPRQLICEHARTAFLSGRESKPRPAALASLGPADLARADQARPGPARPAEGRTAAGESRLRRPRGPAGCLSRERAKRERTAGRKDAAAGKTAVFLERALSRPCAAAGRRSKRRNAAALCGGMPRRYLSRARAL